MPSDCIVRAGQRVLKAPPLIGEVRCEQWDEGMAAEVMHVGPYADEPATIERLHGAIAGSGLGLRGCHREIHISDAGGPAGRAA